MPERTVISNTSPILYLHQVGHLDLLRRLYARILVPSSVRDELRAGAERRVDVPELSGLAWIEVRKLPSEPLPPAVEKLGAGEAGAIYLGLRHQPCLLLLDDLPARRIASELGLTRTGTLGILIKAKQRGLIAAVAPVLKELATTTMWLGEDLIAAVLAEAGEGPSTDA
ncbi:MAG: DUF3368 domain-containing protein [Acidobacteria bacterium]|nr:MAG: DUF3368 domain-containing protein [Acidobacteriota bacterium]